MPEYPKREQFTPATVRGTVCYRDVVTIRSDNSPGGIGQPDYQEIIAENLLCDIQKVSGGEIIRGRQVESKTDFVICCPYLPGINGLDPRCEVEILSGPYTGQKIYVGNVHYETARSRPVATQLHCSAANQW